MNDKLSTHIGKIEARWQGLEERVQAKLATFAGADRSTEARLLSQAAHASTVAKRVHWLRKAAETATRDVAAVAACRKGCAHCCRITVAVSRAEAQVIAKETGRPLNKQAGAYSQDSQNEYVDPKAHLAAVGFGKPCPFLKDETCSIYAFRPLACRLQVNLDEDDLLCQLVEGHTPSVPYLNLMAHHAAAVVLMGQGQAYDDIRQWFPEDSTK
ncbi:YkgJ family cysteine cluster protein [Acidovorax sp.]|uniref:YkgJ family cysteine cluster protein n=1 Tax=Acidovorax sp. TaxID=1872122 RepID=UPI00391EFE56